jgi:TonB family protein
MKNRTALPQLFVFSALIFNVFTAFTLAAVVSAGAQETAEGNRKIVSKVMPQYPALLRSMNIQGNVRADVLVAPDGKVKSVEVTGGHPLLGQAAEAALRQWRWVPAAHESHETVDLIFKP